MSNVIDETPEEENSGVSDSISVQAESAVVDLTDDLKRVMAEYANYRKRVERDKDLSYQNGVADTLLSLVEIMDDISLAKLHGEYQGGFQQVGEKLSSRLLATGLSTFGEIGELFDPKLHDAIGQEESNEVLNPTIDKVFQVGYLYQDKVLRPAVVVLKVPVG